MSDNIDDLKDEIQTLRREREQLGVRLLELQQRVTALSLAEIQGRERGQDMVEGELRRIIADQARAYEAITGSLTWRASAPVRKLRRYLAKG